MHEATYKSQMRSGLPPDQTLLDAAGKVIEVRQLEGVREGGVVDLPEVPARTFGAIWLTLEVERRAPIMTLLSSNFLHDPQFYHLIPRFLSCNGFWRTWKQGSGFCPDWRMVSCRDGMLHTMLDVPEVGSQDGLEFLD